LLNLWLRRNDTRVPFRNETIAKTVVVHLKKPMNEEKVVCVECKSDYFKNSSEMAELCPNCAHELYGYPNCKHKFDNGNCKKCGWNGKQSEFVKNRQKKDGN